MSATLIFNQPGRNSKHMPVDLNISKQQLIDTYRRGSFSTENSWPDSTPSAGFYDVTNSSTKLVLLNNQKTWSHLRGKVLARREPFRKDPYYEWVEIEHAMKSQEEKNKDRSKSARGRSRPSRGESRHKNDSDSSPERAQSRPKTTAPGARGSTSSTHRRSERSQTARKSEDPNKKREMEEKERELLVKYLMDMRKERTGLNHQPQYKNPPEEFSDSYNINHPDLTHNQRLIINNLCHVYSVHPLKQYKKYQYLSLLEKQRQMRMYDNDQIKTYREFIVNDRLVQHPVNCGFMGPRNSKSAASTSSNNNNTRRSEANLKSSREHREKEKRRDSDVKSRKSDSRSTSPSRHQSPDRSTSLSKSTSIHVAESESSRGNKKHHN